MSTPRTALLALAALGASGCYATWDIGPKELPKLSGYSAPARVELVSTTGRSFAYGPEHSLVFYEDAPREGALVKLPSEVWRAQLDDIRVDGARVEGTERTSGRRYGLDSAT